MAVRSNITTPLRKETYKNLQLNAGMCLVNFDMSSYDDAVELKTALAAAIQGDTNMLGATRGGGTFTITREIRQVEADGQRYRFKGSEIVDSTDGFLSVTLIEITPEHLQYVLGNVDVVTTGKKTVITMRTAINDEDYLENLVWVGDTSEGFVAIELKNALNTADFTFTFADKTEGTVNAEYYAHQDDVNDYDNAPFRIYFLDGDTSLPSVTYTSAEGTNVGGTKITTTNVLGTGEHYAYKVANAAIIVGKYEPLDYTWTEWDGTSDIDVGADNNGKKITIAVVNSSGKAIACGNVTLVVKTA